MRRLLIIGIGAGNPDYITIQAVKALNEVDVVFIPDKGAEKAALRKLRLDLCERYAKQKSYRLVDMAIPARDAVAIDYETGVRDWHAQIAARYEASILEHLADGECGGVLVWGDPTLYDSTIRIIETIRSRQAIDLDYEVIPGISSVQALAARHRMPLNRIGQSIHITTGRRLAETIPDALDSVVVLLDGEQAFTRLSQDDIEIFWGAYIGTDEEILVAGQLSNVKGEIERRREAARQQNGWIMDTYLLRRPGTD